MAGTYQLIEPWLFQRRDCPGTYNGRQHDIRKTLNYISVTAGKDLSQLAAACPQDKHVGYAWRRCLLDAVEILIAKPTNTERDWRK